MRSFLLMVFTSLFIGLAGASEQLTVTPSINYFFFDDQWNVDDDQGYGLALGYQFDTDYSFELTYQYNDAKLDASSLDIEYQLLSIDALFHLSDFATPMYLRAGLGEQKSNPDVGLQEDDTILKLGFGLTRPVNKHLTVSAELQAHYGFDESQFNYGLQVGLTYQFDLARKGGSQASRSKSRDNSKISYPTYPDRDQDGVPDHKDACDQVVPKGKKVDELGCIIGDQ